jgi:hypothetical protein
VAPGTRVRSPEPSLQMEKRQGNYSRAIGKERSRGATRAAHWHRREAWRPCVGCRPLAPVVVREGGCCVLAATASAAGRSASSPEWWVGWPPPNGGWVIHPSERRRLAGVRSAMGGEGWVAAGGLGGGGDDRQVGWRVAAVAAGKGWVGVRGQARLW